MNLSRSDSPFNKSGFALRADEELEARLGRFQHNSKGLPVFGASKMQYDRIMLWIRQFEPTYAESTVRIYPDSVRLVVPGIVGPEFDGSFWEEQRPEHLWERKEKNSELRFDHVNVDVRINVSSEQLIPRIDGPVTPSIIRYRRRTSARLGAFMIDVTETTRSGRPLVEHEIEVEYVGLDDDRGAGKRAKAGVRPGMDVPMSQFYDLIERVWHVINDSEVPYSYREYLSMETETTAFLSKGFDKADDRVGKKTVKDYLVKPRSLKARDLVASGLYGLRPRLKEKEPELYYMAYKSDGMRCLLINNAVGIWAYYPPVLTRLLVRHKGTAPQPFILDGEFISAPVGGSAPSGNVATFIPFDVITATSKASGILRQTETTDRSYRERLTIMESRVKMLKRVDVPGFRVQTKDIRLLEDCNTAEGMAAFQAFIEAHDDQPYETDGIIFTPSRQSYHKSSSGLPLDRRVLSSHPDVVKWKPTSMLTIDFTIKREGGRIVLYSYDDRKSRSAGQVNVPFTISDGDEPFPSSKIQQRNPLTDDIDELTVVEYGWDSKLGVFVPQRLRLDKSSQNGIIVARDNWESIQHPIRLQDLLKGYARSEHVVTAIIKESIYRRIATETRKIEEWGLVELGSGRGGELGRWKKLSMKKLVAVEPNKAFISDMENRIEEYDASESDTGLGRWTTIAINKVAEDATIINDLVRYRLGHFRKQTGKVTQLVTSSMMSGSFFSDSPNRLRRYVHLMSRGRIAHLYSITVQGLEAALGPKATWKLNYAYDIFPATITILQLTPLKIEYTNTQSSTAGKQTEYPLDVSAVVEEFAQVGFKAEMVDVSSYYELEIEPVSRYMSMYQYIRAVPEDPKSAVYYLDKKRALARTLSPGETEDLGATGFTRLVRTKKRNSLLSGSITVQDKDLRTRVEKIETSAQAKKTRQALDKLARVKRLEDGYLTELTTYLNRSQINLRIFDLDTGAVVFSSAARAGRSRAMTPELMICRYVARDEKGGRHYEYDPVTKI